LVLVAELQGVVNRRHEGAPRRSDHLSHSGIPALSMPSTTRWRCARKVGLSLGAPARN